MSTYLVTGASRGLGFELVKQLAMRSDVSLVVAVIRSQPSPQLESVTKSSKGRVVSVVSDISSATSVDAALQSIDTALGTRELDVLINNAGTSEVGGGNWKGEKEGKKGAASTSDHAAIAKLSDERLMEVFNVNVNGAHRMTQAMMPALKRGKTKKVVNITSTLGSIAMAPEYRLAPQPAYKITKAALNMLTAQYALDYEAEGFTIVALSPGWLVTDLSEAAGGGADLPVEVGAKACVDQIVDVGPGENGKFLNIHVPGWENVAGPNKYDGKIVPW